MSNKLIFFGYLISITNLLSIANASASEAKILMESTQISSQYPGYNQSVADKKQNIADSSQVSEGKQNKEHMTVDIGKNHVYDPYDKSYYLGSTVADGQYYDGYRAGYLAAYNQAYQEQQQQRYQDSYSEDSGLPYGTIVVLGAPL